MKSEMHKENKIATMKLEFFIIRSRVINWQLKYSFIKIGPATSTNMPAFCYFHQAFNM